MNIKSMKPQNRIFSTFLLAAALPLLLMVLVTGLLESSRLTTLYRSLLSTQAEGKAVLIESNRLSPEAAVIGKTGYMALLSQDGKVITAGKNADTEGLETLAASTFPLTKNQSLTADQSGMNAEILFLPLPADGRILAAVMPRSEIRAAVLQLLWPLAVIMMVSVIILLSVSIRMTRNITGPVSLVTAQLAKLATGNADLTLRFRVGGRDEIGQLCHQFNLFLESLHDDISQILESARKFSSFASDISSSSRNLSRESLLQSGQMSSILIQFDKFSRNLETLGGHLERQYGMAENNNRLIGEVTGETKRISNEIGDLEQSIKSSVNHLDTSHEMMNRTESGMGELSSSMREVQSRIDEVKQNSDSIGSILQVIEDISARTNLLAMNAAIEASHAGEKGKGFAVVAGEIKKLAENTQRAVKDVRDQIASIRESVELTRKSVKAGNTRAGEIRQYASDTLALFGPLRDGVLRTEQMIGGLRSVFTQLGRASDEIRGSTGEMSLLTATSRDIIVQQKEGYGNIQKVIEIGAAKSEEYAYSSQSLAELGTYLKVGESELLRIVQNYIIDKGSLVHSDKRRENRSHILYNLEIRDKTMTKVVGYVGNISRSGFLMLAVEPFGKGDREEFNIQPPFVFSDSSKMIRLTAECRWVSNGNKGDYIQHGFLILAMEPDHRRRYEELSAELSLGGWRGPESPSKEGDEADAVEELS